MAVHGLTATLNPTTKDTTVTNNDSDKPQTIDLNYVRTYVAGLKNAAHAKCRENRHAFPDRPKISLPDPQDDSVVEVMKKCRRCHVKRTETLHVDHVNRTAHRFAVKYEGHAEGYLMEPGHGRLDSEGLGVIRYENLYNEVQRQAGGH